MKIFGIVPRGALGLGEEPENPSPKTSKSSCLQRKIIWGSENR